MFTRLQALFIAAALSFTVVVQAKEVDVRQQKRLQSTVMNSNLPLEKRIEALKLLHADTFATGKIERTFCVWDILGKAGPVYATVADQQFRSMHYGLELTLEAYQDEDKLVADLKSGVCDAALMSGARALEFNRYTGTIEALGAVPSLLHLQTIFTVLSSPKTAKRMTEGDYVVLGVASLGENYLYTASSNIISLQQLREKAVGVPEYDVSLNALAQRYQVDVNKGKLLSVVNRFTESEDSAMLAPIVGYHIGGSGKVKRGMGIVNAPISQSTIQLIGRADLFPLGVAQILREDFLLKFENYTSRVEVERANIPKDKWFGVAPEKQQEIANKLQELRISLRDQGVYDADMIKLAKRVRCRVTSEANECRDNRE